MKYYEIMKCKNIILERISINQHDLLLRNYKCYRVGGH